MSARQSFTSEYIYSQPDYEKIKAHILSKYSGKSKSLCIAPPAKWSNGIEEFETPIIQGKTAFAPYEFAKMLSGCKTEYKIDFVVISDETEIQFGIGKGMTLIRKYPDGWVDYKHFDIEDIE